MSIIQKITLAITIIGAINWGLIGIFDFNLVAWICQDMTAIARSIYIVVGFCGLFNIALMFIPNRHKLHD